MRLTRCLHTCTMCTTCITCYLARGRGEAGARHRAAQHKMSTAAAALRPGILRRLRHAGRVLFSSTTAQARAQPHRPSPPRASPPRASPRAQAAAPPCRRRRSRSALPSASWRAVPTPCPPRARRRASLAHSAWYLSLSALAAGHASNGTSRGAATPASLPSASLPSASSTASAAPILLPASASAAPIRTRPVTSSRFILPYTVSLQKPVATCVEMARCRSTAVVAAGAWRANTA